MSAQERREGEREGRKKAQTVASLVEPGRRSCIVDQGGRADCGHGAAVSVKFSRPTLNGPFATPCLSSPPAGDSLGLHAFCFPRRPLEKKNGLKRIRHSTFERRTFIGVSSTFSPSSNKGLDPFRRNRDSRVNRTSSRLSFSSICLFFFFSFH